ncbi:MULTISPECIES: IS630 family transposase [Gracilibacillus]|uniref:IS630 family transposase n=1 Tax=Gracilibacillus TaxID=74385 RepID=UPI0008257BFB|nr:MULTISPECIES: IS630 family transposase [Gracilibacillus]
MRKRLQEEDPHQDLLVMFQDEAGFGRISKPKSCWTPLERPIVPSHHIREYRYAYGAVGPQNGDCFFLVLPRSNTACMNIFLSELSQYYENNHIVLICDNASWHKSKALIIPNNVTILHILPYTPEMNPIEQIWNEIRKRGFANKLFHTLEAVVDQLCETMMSFTPEDIQSITHREWVLG